MSRFEDSAESACLDLTVAELGLEVVVGVEAVCVLLQKLLSAYQQLTRSALLFQRKTRRQRSGRETAAHFLRLQLFRR